MKTMNVQRMKCVNSDPKTNILYTDSFCSVFNFIISEQCPFFIKWNSNFEMLKCYWIFFSRPVVVWQKPFCVDLQEATFATIRTFLENFCCSFDEENPPAPFHSHR